MPDDGSSGQGSGAAGSAGGETGQAPAGAGAGASGTTGQQPAGGQGQGAVAADLAALGVTAEEYAALGDPGKRALERVKAQLHEHRAKVDELTPLAQKARELEEAGKSETEKLTTKLTAAEQRADTAEGAAIRLKACLAAGMTGEQALDLADRLKGKTEAELLDDAKKLATTLVPAAGQRRTTDPALGAGNGNSASGQPSMSSLIRQAAGREV